MSDDILSSNYFALFELPVSYDVDLEKVQQHYMQLQKQVHPDRFANASDQEKRLSMQQTSLINEAQATLKDPVLRATYLLSLKGEDINLENETTMDADFLMQQLELREKIENIQAQSDPLQALDVLSEQVNASNREMQHGFTTAYEEDRLQDCREWIRKLQFMKKTGVEIDDLAARIEDELMS